MKVVFLDIDGVLNYHKCPYKIGAMYFVDPDKILLLKRILDKTGARVVLSSSWRYGWSEMELYDNGSKNIQDFKALRDELEEYGIHMIGKTPRMNGYRGGEIDKFLKTWKGEEIERFVILDDDSDMEPYMSQLVKTTFMTGLCEEHVLRAIKMLES